MFSISDNDYYSYKLFLIVLPDLFKTCTKSTTEPPDANIQIDNFEYNLVEARDSLSEWICNWKVLLPMYF